MNVLYQYEFLITTSIQHKNSQLLTQKKETVKGTIDRFGLLHLKLTRKHSLEN